MKTISEKIKKYAEKLEKYIGQKYPTGKQEYTIVDRTGKTPKYSKRYAYAKDEYGELKPNFLAASEKYLNIKTQYVKEKLKTAHWENRSYIDDLLSLERLITKGAECFAEGLQFHSLRNQYPSDYLAILKELNLKRYVAEKKSIDLEKQRDELLDFKEKLEDETLKEGWKKAGGKI